MTPGTKVFMIDDDPIYSLLMTKTLANCGLNTEVNIFYDGLDALQCIEQNLNNEDLLPEFIFLDVNMPVMGGWEFLDKFKSVAPFMRKVPAIYVLSSSISPYEVERAGKIPFVKDYLVKPLLRRQLLEIVGANEEMILTRAS